MCHPSSPLVILRQQRWNGPSVIVQRTTESRGVADKAIQVAAQSVGGRGKTKQCVCSPTRHPGSFRCKHHRAEYVWGGRKIQATALHR
ncbi:hypothetical protein NMG60_11013387 [Bertholletia excelsa]